MTISEDTLNARAPRGIKIEGGGGNGTVRVSGEVTAFGNQVPVTADMKVEVKDGVLRLTPAKVTIAGGFTVPNAERLITFTVPVQGLPLDLKITRGPVGPRRRPRHRRDCDRCPLSR